jgi:hypothetical protein
MSGQEDLAGVFRQGRRVTDVVPCEALEFVEDPEDRLNAMLH